MCQLYERVVIVRSLEIDRDGSKDVKLAEQLRNVDDCIGGLESCDQ
jgi:hypothetical protein